MKIIENGVALPSARDAALKKNRRVAGDQSEILPSLPGGSLSPQDIFVIISS